MSVCSIATRLKPAYYATQKQFTNEIKGSHGPRATRKIYKCSPYKKPFLKSFVFPKAPSSQTEISHFRVNELNVQMLSSNLYKQLFGSYKLEKASTTKVNECRKKLLLHNIIPDSSGFVPDVNFQLPKLVGQNIEEHFYNIALEQISPYRKLLASLLQDIPRKPVSWLLQPGWTRYEPFRQPQSVPYPLEEALLFDIEVCVAHGKKPTLATAVSHLAWYSWVSNDLLEGVTRQPHGHHNYQENELIPLESTEKNHSLNAHMRKPKLVVGHHVSYDRARIREQYWPQRTGTRFLDTMSLHVCVSGLTSYQKAMMTSKKKTNNASSTSEADTWMDVSSLNNLADVYKLYCGKELAKSMRDMFVVGTLSDIKANFQNVMDYCSADVRATHKVLQAIWPIFEQRFPHPVTLAGMLELSTPYLPVNNNWLRYIDEAEQAFEDANAESKLTLAKCAENTCHLLHNNKYKSDMWMWDQDWQVKKLKIKMSPKPKKNECIKHFECNLSDECEESLRLMRKFEMLHITRNSLPDNMPLLSGYPNWYRKLCAKFDGSREWLPSPTLISTGMQITPKLLSLTWYGFPLHYIKKKGWGFLVPLLLHATSDENKYLEEVLKNCQPHDEELNSEFDLGDFTKFYEANSYRKQFYEKAAAQKSSNEREKLIAREITDNFGLRNVWYFYKLPHKNGFEYNVGNPLSKDFISKFSENVLSSSTPSAKRLMEVARQVSYWRNNRDRILGQMVVWLSKHRRGIGAIPMAVILPQVVVCGTLTRRAMEPTWLTASNIQSDRIGSELRAMVQTPPSYKFVGADVDSQELWIASVIGDSANARIHGATPFGCMTISGTKAAGTDMHSITAKAIGITRDHAKILNYARIYGAGFNFAQRLLKQFIPSLSDSEARSKALKIYKLTKGRKMYRLRETVNGNIIDYYTAWQAKEWATMHGKSITEMFIGKWLDGTESEMFNQLEAIASKSTPETPFLGSRLSRALELGDQATRSEDSYLPTRINWVVQSGAVDFLHLILVCMRWLMKDEARLCLSFHDEVRYLVHDKWRYTAALALHISNLLTRSFCSARLGIYDLPQSVAFFSSVEVDTVLRKNAKHTCQTPSNPYGLHKGYGIPTGESLDIYETLEKTTGIFPS